jgi:D-alanyl-D-alanine carboxypeptidase (penicillin-binding protein 5/6)
MRLIAVVLGSNSIKAREDASAALLNYGFTFYETVNVKQRATAVLKPRVYKSADEFYAVGPAADVNIVVPRGQAGSITTSARACSGRLIAPLTTSTQVGELQVIVDGKPVTTVPLFPLATCPRAGSGAASATPCCSGSRSSSIAHGRTAADLLPERCAAAAARGAHLAARSQLPVR